MTALRRPTLLATAILLPALATAGGGAIPDAAGATAGVGAIPDVDPGPPPTAVVADTAEVGWRLLAQLNYRTGEKSDSLAALDGKLVKVPGFTVPLEDFASTATEFLLVPYVGACVHTPPPPPNQLVYIEMDEGKRAKMDGWNPVWVEGVLKIEMTESVYGDVGYTITGQRVYPYEF